MKKAFRRRIERLRKQSDASGILDLIEDMFDELVLLEEIVDGCVERLNDQERELEEHLHA